MVIDIRLLVGLLVPFCGVAGSEMFIFRPVIFIPVQGGQDLYNFDLMLRLMLVMALWHWGRN